MHQIPQTPGIAVNRCLGLMETSSLAGHQDQFNDPKQIYPERNRTLTITRAIILVIRILISKLDLALRAPTTYFQTGRP